MNPAQQNAVLKASDGCVQNALAIAFMNAQNKARRSPVAKVSAQRKPVIKKSAPLPPVVVPAVVPAGNKKKANKIALRKKQIEISQPLFTVAFHCYKKDIPRGVEIRPLSGGQINYKKEVDGSLAKLDLDGMLDRMVVDSIEVTGDRGYCIVYVNCIVGKNESGLGRWSKEQGKWQHDKLVHDLTRCAWGNVVYHENKKKAMLVLKNYSSKKHQEIIKFAIVKAG